MHTKQLFFLLTLSQTIGIKSVEATLELEPLVALLRSLNYVSPQKWLVALSFLDAR